MGYGERNVKGISEGDKVVFVMKGPTHRWGRLDFLYFFGVFFVIKAVSQEISKITQGTLEGISDGLFPTLEGWTQDRR